jgi:epoxyqueuosine reductase
MDAELTHALKETALGLGFVRAGVAVAGPLDPEGDRLRAYVEAGRHGEMGYMAETAEVRADPGHAGMVPGARSVLVLVTPFARTPETIGPSPGVLSRYARGRDYHTVLNRRLRKLEKYLRAQGHDARASCDSRPVFERAWAQRAGVGFVGKNCCLIVPGVGSQVFLSCIVTTAELVPDEPMKERCGSCTLCLDACPTKAFEGPREIDARKCISYLTIEKRGPIPESLREPMGEWIFGCDACQDACPYNRTAPLPEAATEPFAPDPRWAETRAEDFLTMDHDAFWKLAEGTPIKRTGVTGMARNAAIVLGNCGEKRHLPVLERAAAEHPDEVVREAAEWARTRLARRT